MKILVVTLSGVIITLEVDKDGTVSSGKKKLFEQQGISTETQRWIFRNSQVKDEQTFEELNIVDGCRVYMLVVLPLEGSATVHTSESQSVRNSQKHGLIFDTDQIGDLLRSKFNPNLSIQGDSSVFLDAVFEYVLAEVLELGGNIAVYEKRKEVSVEDIQNAVRSDRELNTVCSTLPSFQIEPIKQKQPIQSDPGYIDPASVFVDLNHEETSTAHIIANPFEFTKKVPELTRMLESDREEQLTAVKYLRLLLSHESFRGLPHIQSFIPLMVPLLKDGNNPQLQLETCWALSNICSLTEEYVQAVIRYNAAPILVSLMNEDTLDELKEQAIWGLGNIAGDSPACRDYVLKLGIIGPLLNVFERSPSLNTLRVSAWTLSNLCRGKPKPQNFQMISKKVLGLLSFLVYNKDVEVLSDSLWALSYISDWGDDICESIIKMNSVSRLSENLNHLSSAVVTPALRTIGNILSGNDTQTNRVISIPGVLEGLNNLIHHPGRVIRKECLWGLSNICAASPAGVEKLLEFDDRTGRGVIYKKIVNKACSNEESPETRKEAIWCIINSIMNSSMDHFDELVKNFGIVTVLCLSMDPNMHGDHDSIVACLEGVNRFLERGNNNVRDTSSNYCKGLLENLGGVEKLRNLDQSHPGFMVRKKAKMILSTFFS